MLKILDIKQKLTPSRTRNFISGIFNNSVNILSQILLIPIFINTWGKSSYGEWLLISTIPAYLSVSDLGINVTTTTKICSYVAIKDYKKAIELYKSASYFFLLLSITFIIIYLILVYSVNICKIIGIKHSTNFEVESSLFVLIINTFISHFIGISLGIYRSEGRYDKYQSVMTGIFLLEGIFTLLCILLKGSIISISLCYFFIRVSVFILVIINLKRSYSWFDIGFSSIKNILPLIPASIYYTAYTTGYSIIIQGTSFWVGKNMGPSNLVTFNTIRTLTTSIRSFSGIFYGIFLPEYTVLISQKEFRKAKKVFYNTLTFTIIFSFSLSLLYFLLGDWFLNLWTHGRIKAVHPFFLLMLMNVLINTLSNCASNVLNATNYFKVAGILCFTLSIFTTISMSLYEKNDLSFTATILFIFELSLFIFTFNQVLKVVNGKVKI
ncbi:MAG: hypothetical protein LCH91_09135 [Bacteroidetes bacterium]|nr:hypothetical protein [Bacteroidota bacterium]